MERESHVEDIYDFEVVDEWSESEDPANELETTDFGAESTISKDDNPNLRKPTEGEIDAFLENVKELATSETSGLKADSKSLNSLKSSIRVLNPAQIFANNFVSPNSSENSSLSHKKLNYTSGPDSSLKINRSTVSCKPGGTQVKTFFHDSSHSNNDGSSSYLDSQEQSISSQYSNPPSVKHVEDLQDDFSDYRRNGVNEPLAKQRSHVESDSKYRHRRSPEPSRHMGRTSQQSPASKFSRERFNSRKEMFNEKSNRDKRRSEDRNREKSRSRSRERRRRQRARSRHQRSYLSLSPTPPPGRRAEAENQPSRVLPYTPPTVMLNNAPPYYNVPPSTNMPYTPVPPQPNIPQGNNYYIPAGNLAPSGPGHNLTYPMNEGPKYPSCGGPVVQNQSAPMYNFPVAPVQQYPLQGYPPVPPYQAQQGYQGYGPRPPLPVPRPMWNRAPLPYTPVPSNPVLYPQKISTESSSSSLTYRESSPRRKHSRSSTPESHKSHKRKSKKHSRSPDSFKSRNSNEHSIKSSDFGFHRNKKKLRGVVVIDPSRIPTPPPPPILRNTDDKPRGSEKINKSIEKPLSELLDKETVSLSCLLEAVMETSASHARMESKVRRK